jgi:hypothetical protein
VLSISRPLSLPSSMRRPPAVPPSAPAQAPAPPPQSNSGAPAPAPRPRNSSGPSAITKPGNVIPWLNAAPYSRLAVNAMAKKVDPTYRASDLLRLLGLPSTACCTYHLRNKCTRPSCPNQHDPDARLDPAGVAKLKQALQGTQS